MLTVSASGPVFTSCKVVYTYRLYSYIPVGTVRSLVAAWELPTPFSAMHWYTPSSCCPTLRTRKTCGDIRCRGDGFRGWALWSHTTVGAGLPPTWQLKRTVSPHAASCCCSSMRTCGGSEKTNGISDERTSKHLVAWLSARLSCNGGRWAGWMA